MGIGETGLDYHWCKGELDWQHQRFRTHIRAARRVGLPLVIHTRESAEDTIRIMREEHAEQCGGVMHCFTETWEVAEAALALGFYISFSGVVTFKNARQVQEVAQKVPLERMLIETDSPYLAPVPFRGKTNEPAYVRHVAEFIAGCAASRSRRWRRLPPTISSACSPRRPAETEGIMRLSALGWIGWLMALPALANCVSLGGRSYCAPPGGQALLYQGQPYCGAGPAPPTNSATCSARPIQAAA
ncbi:Uncharacterized deoxyribonuclease YcfH [Chromobacterium violaceum]|uniref:Uncharacterized deoxyribonuclease YcfH n=1 Tax=Chromobacterium violaceum TaxID=536 RepID=A0A447TJ84_CHRVL|nr:Uncharacterized deoxyribonuclease YcfH [Chromobacterium violaceum]